MVDIEKEFEKVKPQGVSEYLLTGAQFGLSVMEGVLYARSGQFWYLVTGLILLLAVGVRIWRHVKLRKLFELIQGLRSGIAYLESDEGRAQYRAKIEANDASRLAKYKKS